MVHGLKQIKEQNDNACSVHDAKRLGIVPPDHPEWIPLTVVEVDKLNEARKLMHGNKGLEANIIGDFRP